MILHTAHRSDPERELLLSVNIRLLASDMIEKSKSLILATPSDDTNTLSYNRISGFSWLGYLKFDVQSRTAFRSPCTYE